MANEAFKDFISAVPAVGAALAGTEKFLVVSGGITKSALPTNIPINSLDATTKLALTKLAAIADQTILGNNTGGSSQAIALTATQVRTLLQLVIGTNVQAWAGILDTIATLTPAADRLPYFTGSGSAAMATFSAFIRTLMDDADAATARATLGVSIGSNVQAWDADLDTLAANITANGQSLVATTYSGMRTLLGLVIGTNVQAWSAVLDALAALSGNVDPCTQYEFDCDCDNAAIGVINVTGTGTSSKTQNQFYADHPGVWKMQPGVTTGGGVEVVPNGNEVVVPIGSGPVIFDGVFEMDRLSDAGDTYTLYVGLSDTSLAQAVYGIYARYTHGTNSGKFEGVCRNNGSGNETATDTTVALVVATWYRVHIVVNAAGTSAAISIIDCATQAVLGTATITTNIPTGRFHMLFPQILLIRSTTGSNNPQLETDLIHVNVRLTNRR